MVKTVPLDVPTAFFLGGLITLLGWKEVRGYKSVLFSPASVAAAMCGIWYGFAVTYFYIRYPDWMLAYSMDSREIPTLLLLLVFYLSLGMAGWASSVITQLAIQEERKTVAFVPTLLGFLVLVFVWGVTWDQYFHIGTYAEYHAGRAVYLKNHKAMQTAMNILGPVGLFPYFIVGLRNILRAKRAT